jgi:DNA-3-methyladenine glycosylase II
MEQIKLTTRTLQHGIDHLIKTDRDLARLVSDLGNPPMWDREPGFPTLVHIILEQQVSLASARAAFNKLTEAAGRLTPEKLLDYKDNELNGFGFSRQKIRYCRELAQAILRRDLDLEALDTLDDKRVRARLMEIKGIGPWTADIYLLMVLLRPDVWPAGDLALAVATQRLKALPARPDDDELTHIANPWRPWRAVAARILWHYYLSTPTSSTP